MSERSDETVPCGHCGADRKRMRLPSSWSPAEVAGWRRIEERFLCDDCKAEVQAEAYAASASADLAFAEDAIHIYAPGPTEETP